ncbi:MAG: MFS transporter [Caldilineaceae bacterium]
MKDQSAAQLSRMRVTAGSETSSATTATASKASSEAAPSAISLAAANRILLSLMLPSMLMPMLSSMSRVALPIVRNDFQIAADMTAWVDSVFTLPFMFLMLVYGRLSDAVGRRRLILIGIVIFTIGTIMTLWAPSLAWLMAGRAIQGCGVAGMMPLGMALISSIFPTKERGKALGTWSTVGPTTGFVSPLLAGFLVDHWGWRAAYAPPLLVAVLAFVVVSRFVPSGLSKVQPHFWRSFDWGGVLLLAGAMTSLLFFLSSRPITGVEPLQDWRLGLLMVIFFGAFLLWEWWRQNPFVDFAIFTSRMFTVASSCGALRMVVMAGQGFIIPLYLVDVHGFTAAYIGSVTMISAGTMSLIVRFGGQLADRWGSRWPTVIGIGVQGGVMLVFAFFPASAPIWAIAVVLGIYGLGAGLVLAALHRAAVGQMEKEQIGTATGLYSMIRFVGAMIGTALGGVILQHYLDQSLPVVAAYQQVFLFFAGMGLLGSLLGFTLREPRR